MNTNNRSNVLDTNTIKRKVTKAEKVVLPKKPACYIIKNENSEKFYVGSTKNISSRLNKHQQMLKNGNHSNINLQLEYDSCNNKDEIIIEVLTCENVEKALDLEQEILNKHHSNLFNISTSSRNPGYNNDWVKIGKKISETKKLDINREKTSKQTSDRWADINYKNKVISSIGTNVVVDNVKYGSIRQASRETGVSIESIKKRLGDDNTCTLTDVRSDRRRKVSVNGVQYDSLNQAANAIGIADNTLVYRLKNNSDKYKDHFYID